MITLVRSLVVAFAVAALVVTSSPATAPAQDKGKDKKEEKAGSVEIYMAKDGFRFRVKDADGKVLAQPTKGYEKREDCVKALETIKAVLNATKPGDIKDAK